jgi:hypothetical protein
MVYGSAFRVQEFGPGLRIEGSGFRMCISGLRV